MGSRQGWGSKEGKVKVRSSCQHTLRSQMPSKGKMQIGQRWFYTSGCQLLQTLGALSHCYLTRRGGQRCQWRVPASQSEGARTRADCPDSFLVLGEAEGQGRHLPDWAREASRAWARQSWGSWQGRSRQCPQGRSGCQRGEGTGSAAVGATVAAQWHTPFHAPWAVAGPHGYQLSGVGGTRNEEGSAPPMAPYSLRALWA